MRVRFVATILAVNTLARYILTALIERPRRLIYLSSSMHVAARAPCATSIMLARAMCTAAPDGSLTHW
jgi:hypothetical protein